MEKGYLKENLPLLSNEPENRHRLTVSERGNYFVKFMKIQGVSPSIIIFNSQKLNVVQMFWTGDCCLNVTTRCVLLGDDDNFQFTKYKGSELAALLILEVVLHLTSHLWPLGALYTFESVTPEPPLEPP